MTVVKGQLHELTEKQNVLYNLLHTENLKFAQARYSVDLQDMFKKIKIYREKLVNIKQNMVFLHEQTTKLKVIFQIQIYSSDKSFLILD